MSKAKSLQNSSFFSKVVQSPVYLLIGLTAILYLNTLFNGYNLDDELVTRNHRLTGKGISAVKEIFTEPYYKDNMGYAYEYRPVVLLTFAIENQFFGEHVFISHLVNLLLYILLVWVFYKTMARLFKDYSPHVALLASVIFACHPIHTEVIASIKNRDEILALLFGVLALWAVLFYTDRKMWYWLLVAPFMLVTGALSKQSIVTMALLIPMAVLFTRRLNFWQTVLISLLLTIPLYPLLAFTGSRMKLLFVIAGVAGSVGVFLLRYAKWKAVLPYLRNLWGQFHKPAVENAEAPWPAFKALLTTRQKFPLVPAMLTIGATAFLFLVFQTTPPAFYMGAFIAMYLAAAVVFYYRGQVFLILPLIVFTGYYFIGKSNARYEDIENGLYILLFALFVASANRYAAISVAVMYVCFFAYLSVTLPELSFNAPVFAVLLTVFWLFRKKGMVWGLAALFLVNIVLLFREYLNGHERTFVDAVMAHSSMVVFIAVAAMFQLKKNRVAVVIALTVVVALSVTNSWVWYTNTESKLVQSVNTTIDNMDVNVSPTEVDRPLNFIEVPVEWDGPKTLRVGTAFEVLGRYLKLVAIPYPMSFYYGYAEIKPAKVTDTVALVSITLHLLLICLAFYAVFRWPLLAMGLLIYLGSVVSFSTYFVSLPGMLGDRYLFVPSVGYSLVITWLFIRLSKQEPAKFDLFKAPAGIKYSLAGLLIIYSLLTVGRNSDWKDDLTLFRRDIKFVDQSAQAHNLLALHLMQHTATETDQQKQVALTQEALQHFRRAQEIYPHFFNVAYDIGRVYSILGRPDSAILAFEMAVSIDTIFPDVYLKLGDLYFQQQKLEKSNYYLRQYIGKQPNEYTGYNKLSYNLFIMKKYNESLQVNHDAISKVPGVIDPYLNIARTFVETKNNDSAYYYMSMADRLQPNNPQIQSTIQQLKNSMNAPH